MTDNKFKLAFLALLYAVTLLTTGTAYSGPKLDDILNYAYVDQGVLMTECNTMFTVTRTISLTRGAPIGQTFAVGLNTEKITKVRVYQQPNIDWQPGEGAELTIWDSPKKQTVIGRDTIWYEFRGFVFGVAEWDVNAPVQPGHTYYLEITYVDKGAGDGKLSPIGVMDGQFYYDINQRVVHVNAAAAPGGDGTSWAKAYRTIQEAITGMSTNIAGQGYLNGQVSSFDLCFQIIGKKRLDRIGNLKKMFARFNLDRPELAEIKNLVDKGDYETAIAKTVAYFEARQSPVTIISPNTVPVPNPNYDLTPANMALDNKYIGNSGNYVSVGPNINWRPETEFDANGNVVASNFSMNRYMPRGVLVNGYLNSGDNKYAQKMDDLLTDCYLDNPPPEASKLGGVPSDDVWSSLNTGVRLGQFFIAYDRVHASPSFSTDCRMAYIMNMVDHADTLIWNGADAGGNWSTSTNVPLLTFSLNFPEFKNSTLWLNTASDRLAVTMNRDIMPDGIESESAPGYQRWMYYNPLADVYSLLQKRGVQTPFYADMKAKLEIIAEYFMHLTMPNLTTPELGDWGDAAPGFLVTDASRYNRQDMLYVGTGGTQGTKPTEVFKLYPSAGIVTMRSDWGDATHPFADARFMMMHGVHWGSHGHADLNGITMYAYGREILTDPGSYVYGSPEHALLCTAVSHNLMTIDGQDQKWGVGDTPFRNWATTSVADYICSWRPAYLNGNYMRELFYIRSNGDGVGDYWIVRDTAEGSGTHSLEQRWHFNPTTVTVDNTTLTANTGFATDGNLSIMQIDPSRLTTQQSTIDTWLPRGSTGDPTKLPTLIYKTNAALPAAIDTVLMPYRGNQAPQSPLQTITKSTDGRDSVFKITQGSVSDLFILQRIAGSRTVTSEGVTFNGERLFVRKINGVLRSALIINGKQLTVNGQQIVNQSTTQPWIKVEIGASGTSVTTSSATKEATN